MNACLISRYRKLACAALTIAWVWPGTVSTARADSEDSSVQSPAQKSIQIDFSATPLSKALPEGAGGPFEEFEIAFTIKDRATQQPLSGKRPGAWIDNSGSVFGAQAGGCKQKIDSYLKSSTGARPIVDLTSYYILSFNRDPSISVIDPLVGITGRSNLLATIALSGSPGDWAKSSDDSRIYVSIPSAGKIAIIDAESFRLLEEIEAGERPMRIMLSADARYIFVANDADTDDAGGLTVIEEKSRKIVAHFSTARGHHEMAQSQSGDLLFVSNREKGDVGVFDVATLKLVTRIPTGKTPIALTYSKLAQALYVADGVEGKLTVIDGRSPRILAHIMAQPGLGPIAIAPDGRWALVINTKQNLVHVIEIATNKIVQNIPVGARPYQLLFSEAFAYVVSLDSERINMISLREIGKPSTQQTSSFAAGALPPAEAPQLGPGFSIARAIDDAAVIVANPAEKMIYYYMEGMLAPSGSFLNPGKEVRSVGVINHGLKERAPGWYSARVRLPAGADYDAAIMVGSTYQCFPLHVVEQLRSPSAVTQINYLEAPDVLLGKETAHFRFRLIGNKKSVTAATAKVICFSTTGARSRYEFLAEEITDGVFMAHVSGLKPGAYYLYVEAPAWGINHGDHPPINLLVRTDE